MGVIPWRFKSSRAHHVKTLRVHVALPQGRVTWRGRVYVPRDTWAQPLRVLRGMNDLGLGKVTMYYVVYILEDQVDKTWYIGYTSDLKRRLKEHHDKRSPYTSKKGNMKLIYAEMYLHKMDAIGRERFLKSGSGHKFVKKQLKNYFA